MNYNKITLGDTHVDDIAIIKNIENIKHDIVSWANQQGLWSDAGFHIPYIFNCECPKRGDILHMHYEGPLYRIINEHNNDDERYRIEFLEILKNHGFTFEPYDHITAAIFPTDHTAWDDYLAVYRWQWIRDISKNKLTSLHSEVFEYFSTHPERLYDISWREYEEFVDAVFRNQGFHTELGPGSNDGGVDIRLYRNLATPEIVTIVQAKRYKTRPIGLENVAALLGIAAEQHAVEGIFVTTSRFQPKAKSFAETTQRRVDLPSIQLADSNRVAEWCNDIAASLKKFYRGGQSTFLPSALTAGPTELTGKVVVASSGYNIVSNRFCVIEADFRHESILRCIKSKVVTNDIIGSTGSEVPDIDSGSDGPRFVARKGVSSHGEMTFWGDRHLFRLWGGKPEHFDYND